MGNHRRGWTVCAKTAKQPLQLRTSASKTHRPTGSGLTAKTKIHIFLMWSKASNHKEPRLQVSFVEMQFLRIKRRGFSLISEPNSCSKPNSQNRS